MFKGSFISLSDYFLYYLFNNITRKRMLQVINYNKQLQAKLGISLINYKIFSGKYLVYETKTKGKIYNSYTDKLIFEGEFLNGKKNGKGREYFGDGRVKCEGEYIKGEKNGKRKEYSLYGDLKFDKDYMNRKIWNMKEYDTEGNIINVIKKGKGLVKNIIVI